ncbi:Collagen alpha-5(VI) chain [Bulinus truncatus]|nr:Collagen alpha-5(VI) chain [Bulinus truncatus]
MHILPKWLLVIQLIIERTQGGHFYFEQKSPPGCRNYSVSIMYLLMLCFIVSPYINNVISAIDYPANDKAVYEENNQNTKPPSGSDTGKVDYTAVNNPQYEDYNVPVDGGGDGETGSNVPDYKVVTDPVYEDYKGPDYEYETTLKPTTKPPTTTTAKPTTTTAKPTTALPATTTTTQKPCIKKSRADIIFVLDASSSIKKENWIYQTKFAAEVTQAFAIGPDDVQFGTEIFNSDVTKIHDLNTYSDKKALYNTIYNIPYPISTGTYTYRAFRKIREDGLFTAKYGGRNIRRIVIVMTDGESSDRVKTTEEAALLKKDGVIILTVGIGSAINMVELRDMASDPEKNVFVAGSYELLNLIKNSLLTITCEKA